MKEKSLKEVIKQYEPILVLIGFLCTLIFIGIGWKFWLNRDMPLQKPDINSEEIKCITVTYLKRDSVTIVDKAQITELLSDINELEGKEKNPYEKFKEKTSIYIGFKWSYQVNCYSSENADDAYLEYAIYVGVNGGVKIDGTIYSGEMKGKELRSKLYDMMHKKDN